MTAKAKWIIEEHPGHLHPSSRHSYCHPPSKVAMCTHAKCKSDVYFYSLYCNFGFQDSRLIIYRMIASLWLWSISRFLFCGAHTLLLLHTPFNYAEPTPGLPLYMLNIASACGHVLCKQSGFTSTDVFVPTFPSFSPKYMNGSERSKDQRVTKLLYFNLVYSTIVSGASNTAFRKHDKHHYKSMWVWWTLLERNDNTRTWDQFLPQWNSR